MQRPASFALRYYAYRVTAAAGFTAPIWYLYLYANGLTFTEVAVVNAVWWSGLLVFELPTGYLGDRIGRRESLLIGTVVVTISTLAMIPAESVWEFAAVFAVWAAGQTFRSGTDDAWLYDAIGAANAPADAAADAAADGPADAAAEEKEEEEEEVEERPPDDRRNDIQDDRRDETPDDRQDETQARFLRLKSRGTALALATTGLTALLGGWLAESSMAYAFLAAAGASALGLPILATFPRSRDADADRLGTFEALPVLREELWRPGIRSFVLLLGLFTGVHWGVNFFVQPVSVDLGVSRTGLGVLYAGFTGLGAIASYRATWIADRVGVDTWFRTVPLGLAVVLVTVAVVPVLAIPAFVAIRTAQSASRPLAASWLNDRIGSVGRATVLSAQGMVATALTIPFELGAGSVASVLGPLPTVGLFGALLGVGALGILGLGRPFRADPAPGSETEPAGDTQDAVKG